ncbi:MAG: autotransporter domain-containing protein [Rhodobacteraceae bacterium]|nr:autotransporter domain-containing protein [Paracoccaceae bacterium]
MQKRNQQPVTPVSPRAAYIGGKKVLSKALIERINQTPHTGYAEAFVGMGGVFLRRDSKPRQDVMPGRHTPCNTAILWLHCPQMPLQSCSAIVYKRVSCLNHDGVVICRQAGRLNPEDEPVMLYEQLAASDEIRHKDIDAGRITVSRSGTLRQALLLSAAAGAMFLGYGRTARAQSYSPTAPTCTVSGTTVTCTGDLSVGVDVDGGAGTYTTLDVNTLTTDIAPAGGTRGIEFTGDGDITITSDTGDFEIMTENADGIFAHSRGGGAVEVTQTGDITTEGDEAEGIFAYSRGGDISVTLKGGTITSALSEAIEFHGGATNRLTIYNEVTVSGDTANDRADVLGGDYDETINNYGTFTAAGIIDLGDGANAFNNMEGATFNSGTSVNLGDGNLFTNAGDLSPGGADAVQVTALTGDFLNSSTGSFTVTIDETANVPNDRLDVSGSAIINGGTVAVSGTALDGETYTILTAGDGVTGTFDNLTGVIDTLFVDYFLEYDTTNVYLSSNVNGDSFCDFASTANQLAVACDGLDSLSIDSDLAQAVLALTTTVEAQAAYEALSGEINPSLKGALMDNGQRQVQAINSRMHAAFSNGDTQTSTAAFGNLSQLADGHNGFWMTGYGSWGDTDATSNTAQMDNDLGGVVFGIDRELAERWRFGVLGGYSQSDVTQSARSSSGSADTWSMGIYGGAEAGATGISFGGIYNWHSIDTARSVSFTGFSESLSASYEAQSWQLFAEAGHKVEVQHNLMLEPFAGISYISLDTDGYSESGGTAALTASSDTQSTTFTTLGMRSSIGLRNNIHTSGMLGWRHAFGDTDPSSTFTLSGSSPFTVTGAPIAQDALVSELGLEAGLSDNAFLGIAYNGQYGDGTTAHGFNARFRAKF